MDLGKSEYTVNELMEREQTLIQEIRNMERNVTFLTQQVQTLEKERNEAADFGNSLASDAENFKIHN